MEGHAFERYQRAANYLTAAQIFLQDNFLLERPLTFDDIKPRLLGHWGSGPGVNFAYSHLSNLAKKHDQEMMFILGPGHAFPSLQANLFLEGTLNKYYPEATQTKEGIGYICKNFSWPYGFPSHSNPGTPGVILEGGELGYSLSTSYGAALDNPGLIVACLVGDGEAETGPAATAWHLNKLVNPKTDGVVLPILHLNGYKISGPTMTGRMSNEELTALFTGYGYAPMIVDATTSENPHADMSQALETAYQRIQEIRASETTSPRLPMIVMRTLKGWSGVKELNGAKIEGNALAHQVVLTEAKSDAEQLTALETWLKSYKFEELFDPKTGFGDFVDDILPTDPQKRMGATKHALGGEAVYQPLRLPEIEGYTEDATQPGTIGSSSMRRAGLYLAEVVRRNRDNFRFFSPDETYSNKLDAIFEQTPRQWLWPIAPWDKDLAPSGRAIEMLSEHSLQGLTQGYVLTGRHAIFASYEAFVQIVSSMMDQYAKFLHQANEVSWRGDFPSLNYILTSSSWRQDHNGFSHQNPGFYDDALHRQGDLVTLYFPADGNATLAALEACLKSMRKINVIAAGKTLEARWLTPVLARESIEKGLMTWQFASHKDPDLIFTAAGDYLVKETLATIDLLRHELPEAKFRFVNIGAISSKGFGPSDNVTTQETFDRHFGHDEPIIASFHGYPETLKSVLYNYVDEPRHVSVHGYIEHGSTTTPFDMHVRNQTSRYNLAIDAFVHLHAHRKLDRAKTDQLIAKYQEKIAASIALAKEKSLEPPEVEKWQWPSM